MHRRFVFILHSISIFDVFTIRTNPVTKQHNINGGCPVWLSIRFQLLSSQQWNTDQPEKNTRKILTQEHTIVSS